MSGASLTVSTNLWFGWASLALVVVGGLLGLVGAAPNTRARVLLAVGGLLALLSITVFAVGLENDVSTGGLVINSPFPFPTGIGLFSSSSYTYGILSIDYSTYLSYGFWVALVAAILIFVGAAVRKPVETTPPPPAAPPSPPPPQT
jgi:hypothetical protein